MNQHEFNRHIVEILRTIAAHLPFDQSNNRKELHADIARVEESLPVIDDGCAGW